VDSLLIACADGSLVTIDGRDNIAPLSTSDKTTSESNASDNKGNDDNAQGTSPQRHRLKKHQTNANTDDDDDDDDLFADEVRSPPKNRFLDDEAADDDDDSAGAASKGSTSGARSPPKRSGGADSDDDDDDDDDDGFDFPQSDMANYSRPGALYGAAPKLPDPQAAFAPSSTPLDLTRRYMCWNHIGACTHLQGEAGVTLSSVDIHFTDSAFRRPVTFPDNLGFILGTLGENGALFATDISDDDDLQDDEDGLGDIVEGLHMSEATKAALKKSRRAAKGGKSQPTGSTLFFHRFETFDKKRDKDWYLTLPDGERALGCASGEGWAAVVTSRRFLRTYSLGGNQGQVLWLPGEPVTMVGRSRFMAVFYHEGAPLSDGTQKLGYMYLDALVGKVIAKGSASCLSSGSSLIWAGIGNDFSLLAMDSDGMLSMLASSPASDGTVPSWEWMPVLDTVGLRKSADDSYWPVTVYDGKLVSVLLKGGTKHPDATRRPVTSSLGFRIPLARGSLANTYVASLALISELSCRNYIPVLAHFLIPTTLASWHSFVFTSIL